VTRHLGTRRSLFGLALLGVVVVGLLSPAAGADDGFVAGSGRARASLFEIVPRTGGLSIPVNLGRALTTYQGTAANASSTAVKPPSEPPPAQPAADDCGGKAPGGGSNNTSSNGRAGPGPSKPPSFAFPFLSTLEVNSNDKGAEAGKQADMAATPGRSPVEAALQHQEVAASKDPLAKASTTSGHLLFDGIEMTGGRAEAVTGVVGGKTRLAHALVTIHRLNLLDAVILEDLRWEASQRTGTAGGTEGSFTIGRVISGGTRLPSVDLPATGDPLAAVNQALVPTGLAVDPPRVETVDGVARVTPLSLRLADSALGRQIVGPLVAAFQPVRDPLVQGLLGFSCDFGTAVTVADIAAGMLSGSGGVSFDIGGVSATTEGTRYDNPFAGPIDDGRLDGAGGLEPLPAPAEPLLALSPSAPASMPLADASFASDLPPSGGGAALTDPASASAGEVAAPGSPEPAYLGPASRRLPGHRGGAALAVGLIGLTGIVALGAADALHLRRASPSTP
jgi:hypothetical protein